jgi:hypothetical protein
LVVCTVAFLSSCGFKESGLAKLNGERDEQFAILKARVEKGLPDKNPFCEAIERMDDVQKFQRDWGKIPGHWGVPDEMLAEVISEVGQSVLSQKDDKVISCKQPLDSYTALILAQSIIGVMPERGNANYYLGEIRKLLKDPVRMKRYLAE